jgi:hypothetical protein
LESDDQTADNSPSSACDDFKEKIAAHQMPRHERASRISREAAGLSELATPII